MTVREGAQILPHTSQQAIVEVVVLGEGSQVLHLLGRVAGGLEGGQVVGAQLGPELQEDLLVHSVGVVGGFLLLLAADPVYSDYIRSL